MQVYIIIGFQYSYKGRMKEKQQQMSRVQTWADECA